VILRRSEGQDGLAVSEHEKTHLFALQKFLDHDLRARFCEDRIDRGGGSGMVEGDDDALPRRQPIRLDDDG
jgi:hypothetical protein